ncbi:hypothetical protein AB0758_48960 [Tolypothrix bouteillei VB521301_2]|uniref:hypothetical protein n=1 Tax=Tolypothrix bouteillei TaxID=1246981 RepID=UPI000512FC41
MITTEVREELKRIQAELKKPFPAKVHEVRDLPGGGKKWVFLPWQLFRERLDEVCPEWIIDYSEIQYLNNDAICRAGITILGVRKEAIACVPISVLSSSGKEMTRGTAADRLAAKILKNCGEVWGIGRYIDNQEFTIRYLWERRQELDDKMQSELQRLIQQYKISSGASSKSKPQPKVEPSPFNKPQTGTSQQVQQQPTADLYPANNTVVKRIRTITGHDANWIYAQCGHYGYDRPAMMPPEDLEKLICDMCADFAFSVGAAVNRTGALTSIQSALNFAKQSGQPIVDAALMWLERHQSVSSSR